MPIPSKVLAFVTMINSQTMVIRHTGGVANVAVVLMAGLECTQALVKAVLQPPQHKALDCSAFWIFVSHDYQEVSAVVKGLMRRVQMHFSYPLDHRGL